MANIIIAGVKVPFTRGGQDVLVRTLKEELVKRGHEVDTVELPQCSRKEELLNQAAMWRMLDLREFSGRKVDLVIATKFPTYYLRHPKKSIWLVHQQRAIYDLYNGRFSDISDDPRDEELRRMLVEGDKKAIGEAAYISAISKNVALRLLQYNGVKAEVLYPPLKSTDKYYTAPAKDYILSVSRICSIKRVDLIVKALPKINFGIKLKVVGKADEASVMEYLKNEIAKHHLQDRVEFLGGVSEEELLKLYAESLAVFYAPFDEDYGYVTLEAMASSKPVVTATDSGGILEFVINDKTGLIAKPNSDSIAMAVNRLADNKQFAATLGQNGKALLDEVNLSWDKVIKGLLSPLNE